MKRDGRKSLFVVVLVMLMLLSVGWNAFAEVTISVATQKHPAIDALKELLSGFEKSSGIKVDLNDLPQDQLNAKVELALASGSDEFDVIMLGHMLIPQYKEPGWIESLTQYINDPAFTDAATFDYDDVLQGFLNAASVGGELYAMPFYGESTMLMYNKKMFEEAGLSRAPETMEELEEYAKKLTDKKKGKYGIAMRGRRGINWYPWSGFAYGFGGSWLDDSGKPAINTPEVIEATEFFAKLIKEYGPPGAANFSWNDVQLSMQQGTTAMIIDATNFGPRLENPDESVVVGNVGYAMVPKGRAGRFPSIYSAAIAIPSFSTHKKEAWEFIKWSTSEDVQLETAMRVDRLDVTRKSVWENPKYRERYPYSEMIDTTVMALDEAIAEYLPRIPEFGDLADVLGIAINKVISGEDAKAALDQATKELGPVFEKKK